LPQAERALLSRDAALQPPNHHCRSFLSFTCRTPETRRPDLLGEDSLHRGYPASLRGQQRFMDDVVQMTLRVGGVGVVYWEPAWVSTRCKTRWGTGFALGQRHAVRLPQGKRTHPGGGFPVDDSQAVVGDQMRLKTGLLGIGKIARDQHIPALAADSRFELVACASRNATVDGVANFPDLASMLAGRTGPGLRFHLHTAAGALRRGDDGATAVQACDAGKAAHRHHAADRAAGRRSGTLRPHAVPDLALALSRPASMRRATGLRNRKLVSGKIVWKEDVHFWHPGQRWIWEPAASAYSIRASTPCRCSPRCSPMK
jgi:hypothetical protein